MPQHTGDGTCVHSMQAEAQLGEIRQMIRDLQTSVILCQQSLSTRIESLEASMKEQISKEVRQMTTYVDTNINQVNARVDSIEEEVENMKKSKSPFWSTILQLRWPLVECPTKPRKMYSLKQVILSPMGWDQSFQSFH